MKNLAPKRSLLAVLLLLSLQFGPHASAASPVADTGLNVTPAQLSFSLKAGQDQQTIPVTLTNHSATALNLSAEFKGISVNGGQFLPNGDVDPSLASSLYLSQTDIEIGAKASQIVNVQFRDNPALSPGGHYATLVITQGSGNGQLGLQAALSLTIFATKLSGARQQVQLTSFSTNGWIFKLPSSANLRFKNTGNMVAVPRAAISVSAGDAELVKGIANAGSLPTIPGGKQLDVQTTLNRLSRTWLPRHVTIQVAYRADGSDSVSYLTQQQWYVPPFYLLLLLLLIGLSLQRRRCVVLLRRIIRRTRRLLGRRSSVKKVAAPKIVTTSPISRQINVSSESDNAPSHVIVTRKKASIAANRPAKKKRPKASKVSAPKQR